MDSELRAIRNDFPIVQNQIYVNHAAVGPIPRSVAVAMQSQIDIQLHAIGEAWERAAEVKKSRPAAGGKTGQQPSGPDCLDSKYLARHLAHRQWHRLAAG